MGLLVWSGMLLQRWTLVAKYSLRIILVLLYSPICWQLQLMYKTHAIIHRSRLLVVNELGVSVRYSSIALNHEYWYSCIFRDDSRQKNHINIPDSFHRIHHIRFRVLKPHQCLILTQHRQVI